MIRLVLMILMIFIKIVYGEIKRNTVSWLIYKLKLLILRFSKGWFTLNIKNTIKGLKVHIEGHNKPKTFIYSNKSIHKSIK